MHESGSGPELDNFGNPVMSAVCGRPDVMRRLRGPPLLVESRCGAVVLGCTYLLPPLSSGGALVV
jgi:hypothetical protein